MLHGMRTGRGDEIVKVETKNPEEGSSESKMLIFLLKHDTQETAKASQLYREHLEYHRHIASVC